MTERKDIKGQIHSRVAAATAIWGFKYDRKEKLLVRRAAGKYDLINIIVLYYGDIVDVQCVTCVGVEDMEVITKHTKIYGFPPKYSFSVSMNIWWNNGTAHRLDFRGPVDLETLVRELAGDLQSTALPFFDRFKTTEDVDSALNSTPSVACPLSPNWTHRCVSGIAAAHLCRRKNYIELVELYRDRLSSWQKGFSVPAYDDLVVRLSQQSASPDASRPAI